MKKSLCMLAVMGLSATQINAAVQHEFEPSSASAAAFTNAPSTMTGSFYGNNLNSGNMLTANTNTIRLAQDIESLSAQVQDRENQLSSFTERLITNQTVPSFATSANNGSVARLDSSAPPAIAAARASSAAKSRTVGLCARYVRKALQAAGYNFTPNPSAYQYATRGTLSQAGFTKISNNLPSQVGDVVVYSRSAAHRHGHIQIFDGSSWVSDFRQARKSPYSAEYAYTTWRDTRYLNDASNQGMYLAMGE